MPKLLQIAVECNTGSTGTIAEAIGNIAIKNGWESYIAYGRPYKPSNSHTYKIESKCGVYIHGLITRIFDAHGKGSLIATKKLIKYIKTIKPDIIHLHHLHGYYINIRILFDYLSSSNIPVVWTFHDCWSFTGHCAYFDYVDCNKWQTECYNCPQKKEYPASYLFDRSKRNYMEKKRLFTSVPQMTIISVSKWLDEKVSRSFFKGITHKVIYNGIDTNIFKPSSNGSQIRNKYEIDKSFLILGVASPWSKRKGLDDFIKLSYSLNQNEKILLIGLNDKQIQSLPKNIIGLKKTENKQELADLYSAADVYINLSVSISYAKTVKSEGIRSSLAFPSLILLSCAIRFLPINPLAPVIIMFIFSNLVTPYSLLVTSFLTSGNFSNSCFISSTSSRWVLCE
jgi:putative colanic acid biosynthesis glycosyltransferase